MCKLSSFYSEPRLNSVEDRDNESLSYRPLSVCAADVMAFCCVSGEIR